MSEFLVKKPGRPVKPIDARGTDSRNRAADNAPSRFHEQAKPTVL